MRVESGLFQTVGLGAEAVDLGFVGRDDDVDVANVAEIGAEHHVETVALAVGRIGDAVNAPNEDARRENRGVARRFDDVAGAHLGVARHVVDVGFARTAAVPEEVAEVVAATHAAGDARLAVGDGKHEGVARTDEIDDADYAATAHNTHFGTDAVGTSAIEHEVAVTSGAHVVAHYAGGQQAVTAEFLQHAPFGVGAVVEGFGQGVAKAGVLTLQTEVVVGEGAVDVAQIEETLGLGIGAIELGGAFTGGGEPYAPLIVVEAEKEGETHDFEHDKQEDVVVATEKIEEYLHGGGGFWGGDEESEYEFCGSSAFEELKTMCDGANSFASGDCTGSLSYPFEVSHRMVGGNAIGNAIECVGEQCNLSFVVVEKGSDAIAIFNGLWKLDLCGTKTLFV